MAQKGEIKDLIGQRFGRLTVKEFSHMKNYRARWKCLCDCGNECVIVCSQLTSGTTQSCGCLRAELRRTKGQNMTHGMTGTRIYRIWMGMKRRCTNVKHKDYKYWGGRGIRVLWKSFEEFYTDMQPTYQEGLTIDRKDNDWHYCKENCRWATQKQQANNRRNNISFIG